MQLEDLMGHSSEMDRMERSEVAGYIGLRIELDPGKNPGAFQK